MPGLLIISLDFELYWGVRDRPYARAYIPNLVGARAAIPAILETFTRYGIHATWATVGILFCETTEMLREHAPSNQPQYIDRRLSPYSDLPPPGTKETADSIWFAPSLVRRIADTPNQEIATHTFSHYYCMEAGQDGTSFREDLAAACHLASITGLRFSSLVFPRNQCAEEYLDAVWNAGITSYRGNPVSWIHQPVMHSQTNRLQRALRLADSYLNLIGPMSYQLPDPTPAMGIPINLPASRFLRPYQVNLRRLEALRLQRIKHELTYAARRELVYHLWWHPHNFGRNTTNNIAFLEAILTHYRRLRNEYGMISMNMVEAAPQLRTKEVGKD